VQQFRQWPGLRLGSRSWWLVPQWLQRHQQVLTSAAGLRTCGTPSAGVLASARGASSGVGWDMVAVTTLVRAVVVRWLSAFAAAA
tara:strand:+ start:597 stop:851 length:255 start_codon:yes stop_codon:yes gene_type:complete